MPERIQRKRTKGWRMPPNTVCVTRPGFWGNEFSQPTAKESADLYRVWINGPSLSAEAHRARLNELRGKNLACFCPLDEPCHADVLLEIANR